MAKRGRPPGKKNKSHDEKIGFKPDIIGLKSVPQGVINNLEMPNPLAGQTLIVPNPGTSMVSLEPKHSDDEKIPSYITKETSITLSRLNVLAKEKDLETARQELKIAEEHERKYQRLEETVAQLKINIELKEELIEELEKEPQVAIINNLKTNYAGMIHDHLLGNESMFDDDLESLMEELKKL